MKYYIIILSVFLISCNNQIHNKSDGKGNTNIEINQNINSEEDSLTFIEKDNKTATSDTIIINGSIGVADFLLYDIKEIPVYTNKDSIEYIYPINYNDPIYDGENYFQKTPFAIKVEYDLLQILVIKTIDNKLYIDEDSYVVNNNAVEFYLWPQYLLSDKYMTINLKQQSVYSSPNVSSKTINKDSILVDPGIIVKGISCKNEWLEIEIIEGKDVLKTGWLKWYNKNTLLIDFYYFM